MSYGHACPGNKILILIANVKTNYQKIIICIYIYISVLQKLRDEQRKCTMHGNSDWFRWQYFQASHPLTKTRFIKVNEATFQLCSIFYCQSSKLWKSSLLQYRPMNIYNFFKIPKIQKIKKILKKINMELYMQCMTFDF